MTMQSPAHLAVTLSDRRRLRQSDHFGQIELFDGATPAQMPAFRDLPEETRGTLTCGTRATAPRGSACRTTATRSPVRG